MQKTTAQSQQESQKTRARLTKQRTCVHLMSLVQDNGTFIKYRQSLTTCNLQAYRQASELRLNSFFISTTLLSFEQLIHLDYFSLFGGELVGGVMVSWWRVGWWRKLPGGEMTGYRDKGSRQ